MWLISSFSNDMMFFCVNSKEGDCPKGASKYSGWCGEGVWGVLGGGWSSQLSAVQKKREKTILKIAPVSQPGTPSLARCRAPPCCHGPPHR